MNEKDLERFLLKVDFDFSGKTECWLWNAGTSGNGYGSFDLNYKKKKAHRVSYEHFTGPISEGLNINHTCDNPPCVNPKHLWQGTQKEGMEDMLTKGRGADRKGEKNNKAKLNDEKVSEIRAKYIPYKYIAKMLSKEYGVCQDLIKKIIRRMFWKNV